MPCGSGSMNIGRSSQASFDNACGSGEKATATSVCGSGGSCTTFNAKRNLSKRKNREDVRQKVRDYVLLMLGAPVVKIELDDQGLDIAVDQAFDIYEDYAPREFFDYYVFNTTPGKSVYKMPDDVGVIRNVFYKEQGGNFAFQASDLGGSIPLEYFYPGSGAGQIAGMINPVQPIWGNMGEWVLYKQYENMYARTSSQIGGWEWVSDMGYVKLYPTPCRCSRVMVHYLQKCKDWKDANQALREGALAHAMIILGHIRGKYTQIPGIQGGVQNDGQYMKDKGWELKQKWEEQLITRYGDPLPISMD